MTNQPPFAAFRPLHMQPLDLSGIGHAAMGGLGGQAQMGFGGNPFAAMLQLLVNKNKPKPGVGGRIPPITDPRPPVGGVHGPVPPGMPWPPWTGVYPPGTIQNKSSLRA